MDLDFLPSPLEDRPGLMLRDPFRYSDLTLVVPPHLVPLLQFFDGQQTDLDLKQALVQATGDVRAGELQERLQEALEQAGFVEGESFEAMREARQREFAELGVREPAHAGGAYPDEPEELKEWLDGRLDGAAATAKLIGIAAPHVSPEGGWQSYSAAYSALRGTPSDRTFVVLGTSHYGEPERFGLTRKDFVTPFGKARNQTALVDWLEKRTPRSVKMEDYCHAIEHSIEFQVLFLQSIFGPEIRILPILCGPFARSIYEGGMPEDDEGVRAFFDALGELNDLRRGELCWVLGVDMAHIGRRYGDEEAATAGVGRMAEIERLDNLRAKSLAQGDAAGFWDQVQRNQDELRWCGSAPFYTFLKACPGVRGSLRHYEQWNIDPQSVVSFGALSFEEPAA